MLRRYILFLKKYPLITAAIAVAYALLCIRTIHSETFFQSFIVRTLLCGAMLFFLYQISGDKTLVASYNSTWYVIKVSIVYWLFAIPFGITVFSSETDPELWENIPWQLTSLFLMFVFVGLFEELLFRAIINDAIIYRFRNHKHVFIISALVSTLSFGIAHVISADLSSIYAWIQAFGKVLSSGSFALGLIFLYWKTRNIWACGIVHGIYDFIISIHMGVYKSSMNSVTYVAAPELTGPIMIVYGVSTALNLIVFFVIYKKIGKQIDYQAIRENW